MEGLSLIVPVHNGENFIESSLKEYHKVFSTEFENLEILFHPFGSTVIAETELNNLIVRFAPYIPEISLETNYYERMTLLYRNINKLPGKDRSIAQEFITRKGTRSDPPRNIVNVLIKLHTEYSELLKIDFE